MRCSADWMVLLDDRLLEYLAENQPAQPSKIVGHECVNYSSEYVRRRLKDNLEPHGLVQNLGGGVYRITDDGEAYLAGELDASQLEE